MDLNACPSPAVYRPYPYARRASSDRPLVALGVVAIVAGVIGFCVWFLVGIGVAMCTDARSSATCRHVSSVWGLTGGCVAASFTIGLVTTIAAGRRRHTPVIRRTLAVATIAVLMLTAVVGADLWAVATSV